MAAQAGVQVGQVLHGTYRVTALIAAGGMGIVYEAEHVRLSQKRFAIKVLHPAVVQDPAAYVRFRREAEIVSGLGHPHIVFVSDFNELDNGQPYLVMELMEGEDLKKRLRRDGRLTPEQVGQLIEQTASALQVAHDKNIIHRDLKPGNIFLLNTPGDAVHTKLLDFGISKIRHSKSAVTEDLTLIGTPFYMAPEQAEGEITDIDHRTDLFSLGTIAYLSLSGKLPFEAASTPGVLFKVCYQDPQPITERVPELPEQVHRVLSRALAKSKTDRYQRVDEFAAALKGALGGAALDITGPLPLPAVDTDELSLSDVVEEPATEDVVVAPRVPDTIKAAIPASLLAEAAAADEQAPPSPALDLPDDSISPSTLSSAVGERTRPGLEEQPPPRRRLPLLLAGGAGVTALAGVAVLLATSFSSAPDPTRVAGASPVVGPAAPAAARADARGEPAPQAAMVRVRLRLTPPTARVLLDNVQRKDNPLVLTPSTRPRQLRVEAPGYLPVVHKFVADADDTIVVSLIRKQPPAAAPRRPAASPARRPARSGPVPSKKQRKGVWIYDDL